MKVKEMLKECLDSLENMSTEEFKNIKAEAGIIDSDYTNENYYNDEFEIILPTEGDKKGIFSKMVNTSDWALKSFIKSDDSKDDYSSIKKYIKNCASTNDCKKYLYNTNICNKEKDKFNDHYGCDESSIEAA